MSRLSEISLFEWPEQPSLELRHEHIKVEDLPNFLGADFAKLGGYVHGNGLAISDNPYVGFIQQGGEMTLRVGFPLPKALPGRGDIQASKLDAGLYVCCMYQGAYSEMLPLYQEIDAYLEQNGLEKTGLSLEYYYTGPEIPEELHLTKVALPVTRK